MMPILLAHQSCALFLPAPSPPLQRAKIGTGSKAADEKTRNAISKLDNNGSRDRMKLSDFNFLMVLGKGSFGKVRFPLGTACMAHVVTGGPAWLPPCHCRDHQRCVMTPPQNPSFWEAGDELCL